MNLSSLAYKQAWDEIHVYLLFQYVCGTCEEALEMCINKL